MMMVKALCFNALWLFFDITTAASSPNPCDNTHVIIEHSRDLEQISSCNVLPGNLDIYLNTDVIQNDSLTVPTLQSIKGNLTISNLQNSNATSLQTPITLQLPSLSHIGNTFSIHNASIITITAPSLQSINHIDWHNTPLTNYTFSTQTDIVGRRVPIDITSYNVSNTNLRPSPQFSPSIRFTSYTFSGTKPGDPNSYPTVLTNGATQFSIDYPTVVLIDPPNHGIAGPWKFENVWQMSWDDGVTEVKDELVVRNTTLPSFSPWLLARVDDLIIRDNGKMKSLSFRDLHTVGGNVEVVGNDVLETITLEPKSYFPELHNTTALDAKNKMAVVIHGNLTIANNTKLKVTAENLFRANGSTVVMEDFYYRGLGFDCGAIQRVNSTGSFDVSKVGPGFSVAGEVTCIVVEEELSTKTRIIAIAVGSVCGTLLGLLVVWCFIRCRRRRAKKIVDEEAGNRDGGEKDGRFGGRREKIPPAHDIKDPDTYGMDITELVTQQVPMNSSYKKKGRDSSGRYNLPTEQRQALFDEKKGYREEYDEEDIADARRYS